MLDEIYEDVAKLIKTNIDYPFRNLMDWLYKQRYDVLTTEQLTLMWDNYDLYYEKYYLAIAKLNTWLLHEDLLFIDFMGTQDFINLSPSELALLWDNHVYPNMEYDKIEFKVSKLCKTDKYKNNTNIYAWLKTQPYTEYTPEQLAQQWDSFKMITKKVISKKSWPPLYDNVLHTVEFTYICVYIKYYTNRTSKRKWIIVHKTKTMEQVYNDHNSTSY